MPPKRNSLPGSSWFLASLSTTSVGELKYEVAPSSVSAHSTSAAASASTPSPLPIKVNRRCLRVTFALAFQSGSLDELVEAVKLVRLACQRLARVGRGGQRLVAVAQHHIGAQQPQPAFDVGTLARQALGEPRHHAAHHLVALLRRQLARGRDILGARPR